MLSMSMDARDYHILTCLNKRAARRMVVRLIWGTQTAIARELGVHQTTVCQIVGLSRTSRRIEEHIRERVAKYGKEFEELWAA